MKPSIRSWAQRNRIGRNFEVDGNFDLEKWKAPVYLPGQHTVTATTIQLTWFLHRKINF